MTTGAISGEVTLHAGTTLPTHTGPILPSQASTGLNAVTQMDHQVQSNFQLTQRTAQKAIADAEACQALASELAFAAQEAASARQAANQAQAAAQAEAQFERTQLQQTMALSAALPPVPPPIPGGPFQGRIEARGRFQETLRGVREMQARVKETLRITAERMHQVAEAKKRVAEAQRLAEAKLQMEAEAQRRAAEARQAAQAAQQEAEAKRQRMLESQWQAAEAQRMVQEAQKAAEAKRQQELEAQRRVQEEQRLAAERERQAVEAKRQQEAKAQRRVQEEQRLAAEGERQAAEAKRQQEAQRHADAQCQELEAQRQPRRDQPQRSSIPTSSNQPGIPSDPPAIDPGPPGGGSELSAGGIGVGIKKVVARVGEMVEKADASLHKVETALEEFRERNASQAAGLGRVTQEERPEVLKKLAETDPVRAGLAGGLADMADKFDMMPSVVLPGGGSSGMIGARGTRTTSSTVWKDTKGARIDVENPNPGHRPGQIHFQRGDQKYLYDPATKTFKNHTDPSRGVPREVQKMLEDEGFQKGIDKAMWILGEVK